MPTAAPHAPEFSDAPKELKALYAGHYAEHAAKGHAEAHRRAVRMTQVAGWYKGVKGWRKVHPDLRDKVTVRDAVRQPDGRYFIEGVPVFYPNAVKGKHLAFDPAEIRKIIKNTNAGIAAGGQKPGLTEGHPNEDQAALGAQLDTHGFPVNWREHPQRPGWAVCDLIDVEPDYVERIRRNRLTGLSAGLAKDAGGNLNRRFGHVAMLGGTTQALSHLPTTQLFRAEPNLCFSADSDTFTRKPTMKLTDKQKACFDALFSAREAYGAAEACRGAGEPGADDKLSEAGAGLQSAYAAFAAEMGGAPEEMPAEGGAEGVPAPAAPPAPAEEAPPEYAAIAENFAADPEGSFRSLVGELSALRTQNRALQNKQAWVEFSGEIEGLRKTGRALPTPEIVKEEFEACFDSREPRKALALRVKAYKSLPEQRTPATFNRGEPAFAAGEGNKPVAGKPAGTREAVRAALPGLSEEDMQYAALGEL